MRLGPYEVRGEIGRGAMGRVYRAVHAPTGVERAIKVVAASNDPEVLERFEREAKTLARVGGRGVVTVHECGVEGRTFWYAMDLMGGGSLAARVAARGGALPWREACSIAAALAHALGRSHAAGVVHRDLKPDNVLFDDSGHPCIADFGCARDLQASAITVEGAVLGTPLYMAPEQLSGLPAGPAADVFALAVILHEMVTGRRPHDGRTLPEILLAATRTRPATRVVAGVPAALDVALGRALAVDPARRTKDASVLARELDALLEGKTLHEGKTSPRARAPLLVLGALGLAGVAVLAARRPSAEPPPGPPAPAPVVRPPVGPSSSATRIDPRAELAANARRLVDRATNQIGDGHVMERNAQDLVDQATTTLAALAAVESASGSVAPDRVEKLRHFFRDVVSAFVMREVRQGVPFYLAILEQEMPSRERAEESLHYLGMFEAEPGVAPVLLELSRRVLADPASELYHPEAYLKASRALKRLGYREEAEALAQKGLERFPRDVRLVTFRALTLADGGQFLEALEYTEPLLAHMDAVEGGKLRELRAQWYVKRRDPERGLAELAAIRPGTTIHTGGLCARAELRAMKGDKESALADLKMALEAARKDDDPFSVRAVHESADRAGLVLD